MERIPVSDWPQFRATVYIPAWYHARIGMTFHLDFLNNMSFMFLYLCYTSCYMLHLFNASHITYTEIHCIHIFLEQWRLIDFLIDKAYLSLQHTFFVTSVFCSDRMIHCCTRLYNLCHGRFAVLPSHMSVVMETM